MRIIVSLFVLFWVTAFGLARLGWVRTGVILGVISTLLAISLVVSQPTDSNVKES